MQIEKTPEPLPYPYTTAPQLREMSWSRTCALDVGQMMEFFSPWLLWPKPQIKSESLGTRTLTTPRSRYWACTDRSYRQTLLFGLPWNYLNSTDLDQGKYSLFVFRLLEWLSSCLLVVYVDYYSRECSIYWLIKWLSNWPCTHAILEHWTYTI
jgi:hypothetical protein